jgi:ATP-dependent DNA helicase
MIQKVKVQNSDSTINLVLDTINKNKQTIVFANTKKSAEKCAEDISKQLKKNNKEFEELANKVETALSSKTKQCERLARCIKQGIAFHHAGLNYKQRELIEDNFRNGKLFCICSTPTLALGLDLPAYRVILKDLRRYSTHGLRFIPVLEYLQMCGRAGRPKFENTGQAIAITNSSEHKQKIIDKYINGFPEDIESKLAVEPVLRTYLLSLIASNFVNSKKEIFNFFKKTFWAYQFEDLKRLNKIIEKIISMLIDWKFIKQSNTDDNDNEFQAADTINNEKYDATLLGKRVSELYVDPLTAYEITKAIKKTKSTEIKPFSFIHVVASTLEMRPFLKVKVKEYDDIQSELNENSQNLLKAEPDIYDYDYDDYLNGVKTAIMLFEWTNELSEKELLEIYNVTPGELNTKLAIADWLLYTTEELARIQKNIDIIKYIKKTRLMLKHGAKEELLILLKLKNIGRIRARKMFNNKIKDIKDVKNADISKLVGLIGKSTTIKIKKEVGVEIKTEIKETKRVGQMSLHKFNKKNKTNTK